jgi:hypothetical protein
VTVEAPPWIELTAHRGRRDGETERILVHLVNYSGHDGATLRWSEPLPIANVAVTIRPGFKPTRVHATRLGRDLLPEPVSEGAWRVIVPEVALFEMLAIEGAA